MAALLFPPLGRSHRAPLQNIVLHSYDSLDQFRSEGRLSTTAAPDRDRNRPRHRRELEAAAQIPHALAPPPPYARGGAVSPRARAERWPCRNCAAPLRSARASAQERRGFPWPNGSTSRSAPAGGRNLPRPMCSSYRPAAQHLLRHPAPAASPSLRSSSRRLVATVSPIACAWPPNFSIPLSSRQEAVQLEARQAARAGRVGPRRQQDHRR